MGSGNVENGAVSLSENRVVFSAGPSVGTGHVVLYAVGGTIPLMDLDLTDMATGGHVGTGKLVDPCPGLFTGTATSGTVTVQFFATFLDDAALITSYTTDSATPNVYSYFNGIALRDPAAGG